MKPKVKAVLDNDFEPMSLKVLEFKNIKDDLSQEIVLGVIRNNNAIKTYQTKIYKDNIGHDDENYHFVERLVKTLLWAYGGFKIVIGGSKLIYEKIKSDYTKTGKRQFDVDFMEGVYEEKFEVLNCDISEVPKDTISSIAIGRHQEGNRIGFDAGGSDRKVSAVIDGKSIYSEEVLWHPKEESNPTYHIEEIYQALKKAASYLPKVDAIGVSTAGVCIDNKIMVSSLFLKVAKEDFSKYVKTIYLDLAKRLSKELGYDIPIEVANDGDVTALAGAMEMDIDAVLGIAMGTSEAGGYIDKHGNITGFLNELAFVPVDYNMGSAIDEWSGDYGCGVKYFSQDAVMKLVPKTSIKLDNDLSLALKLKEVQKLLEEGNLDALKIFETIGVYFGYGLAYYSEFYDIDHVLIMGRVTSSKGGDIILSKAEEVLKSEFPSLASKIKLHIPDEKQRRVGQSAAAASLPQIN